LQLDPSSDGVVVTEIEENSLAGRVGFQKGDVILAINGERVNSTREIDRIIRYGASAWQITIRRGGETLTSVFGG
jgi:S1-C subfamily serine protease